jgi:hypothetical protein
MNYENEVWNDVIGTGGMYQLSDNGRYRSRKSGKWKIIKPCKNGVGYLKICTCFNCVEKRQYLHRAMWEAFVGPIPKSMQVDHINGIRDDNRLINLRLLNNRDNTQEAKNRERKKGKTSSLYIGVHWNNAKKKWVVRINVYGKSEFAGYYDCEQVARCVSELAREGIYPPNLQKRLAKEKNKRCGQA